MTEQALKLLSEQPELVKEVSADFSYFVDSKKRNGVKLPYDKSWWDLYMDEIKKLSVKN